MFLDHPWVPSLFIVLLVPVILMAMSFFERRTRIWVYYVAAILMGTFAIYQLYANLSARLDFTDSAACLVVDFIAAAGCAGAAVLERQKSIEEAQIQQQEIPSKEEEEAEPLPINQIKTAEELATIRDIENKIAEKDAKLQQKQNIMNDVVLEWFNEHIAKFDATSQLVLRNCAKDFSQTGKIEIEQEKLPPYNTSYTQLEIIKISSIFRLVGRTREQCRDFALKAFANYFPNSDPSDSIKRKIKGVKTMMKEIRER
ncbi:hypothetical protein [Hallella multisaccharivorax]|uniref:hypothetical protein n=1 Tax=Hallella multisaccharivorax TaxID=310514 RepID=UPI00361158B9